MKITGVHHMAITVRDFQESMDFYCGLLGMEVERQVNGGDMIATYLKIPNSGTLELIQRVNGISEAEIPEDAPGLCHVAFEVDDPKAYADLLREKGFRFHMELSELPQFNHYAVIVYDPNGAIIEFVRKLHP